MRYNYPVSDTKNRLPQRGSLIWRRLKESKGAFVAYTTLNVS